MLHLSWSTALTSSCLCAVLAGIPATASPVHQIQERAPQDEDRPGFFPEVTSLIASVAGDGWDGLLDAIYGNDDASSALAQATSAQAQGDQGAAASYFSQATAAIGDGWTRANSAWSSYTSAYDANNNGNGNEWTSSSSSSSHWYPETTSRASSATSSHTSRTATSTPSPSQSPAGQSDNDTGAASKSTISAYTTALVLLASYLLLTVSLA